MKKIVLTGGGTGGHVYPALALIPNLKNYEIHFIGGTGIEKEILKDYPEIQYHESSSVKLIRRFKLSNLLIPFKLNKSVKEAKKLLFEIKPDVVFSKGGFVAVPVVMAAKKLKIPVISHESDLSMGLANRIILHYAKVMCTSFEETSKNRKKCVYTGAPIRKQIMLGDKSKLNISFSDKKPTLLVLGGSLGAKKINEFVHKNLDRLLNDYNVIHLSGKNSKIVTRENYYQIEFAKDIENFYAKADCVLSRAGAGVIFELLALKKPMILIPLSKECSRGDQIENAENFKKNGYAELILEEDLTIDKLFENLNNIKINRDTYITKMHVSKAIDSNNKILKIIESV